MTKSFRLIILFCLLLGWAFTGTGCGLAGSADSFKKGEQHFERQQYEKSRDAFLQALEEEDVLPLRQAEIQNYLGVIAGLQGRKADAATAFLRAREIQDDYFDPAYNQALLNLEDGDVSKAEEFFSEAATMEGKNAYALEWLGHLALRRGDRVGARRHYFNAMNQVENSPRILTALANVEWAEKRPDDAVTYLMQAMELKPDYAPALFNLARIYDVGFQDADQANAFYQQYLSVAQDTRRIEFARARVAGRDTASLELSPAPPQNTASATPPKERRQPTVGELTQIVDALLAKAAQRKEAGSEAQALNFCLQAAARAKAEPKLQEKALRRATDLCFDAGRGHYELARFLEGMGRTAEALTSYKQAATLDPKAKYIHLDLASLASKLEEDDVALSSLRSANKLDPNDSEVAWELATLLEKLSLNDKAAKAYGQFNNRFPDDPRTSKASERLKALRPTPATQISLRSAPGSSSATSTAPALTKGDRKNALMAYNRATAYLQRKDLDRSIFFFKRAIELDPYMVTAYYNLGLTYRQKGDLARAADMFKSATELKPSMLDAYYNQALVLHDLKRDQEAVNVLKALTRKQPDYSAAYYLAGVIFAQYPEQEALARRYYTQFTQLAERDDPYIPVARQWLSQHP